MSTCSQVRHFLDSSLYDLRQLSMRRISYQFSVACPCSKVCLAHSQSACGQEACLHFLSLDQCLANKVLLCESRQVRIKASQQRFPSERAKVPCKWRLISKRNEKKSLFAAQQVCRENFL